MVIRTNISYQMPRATRGVMGACPSPKANSDSFGPLSVRGTRWSVVIIFVLLVTLTTRQYDLLPPRTQILQTGQDQHTPDSTSTSTIPRKIWQIFSTPADFKGAAPFSIDPKSLGDTTSWVALNPGHQYELLGAASADEFVLKHFSHDNSVIDTYFTLRSPGLKTDLLRYLVLWAEGGVYSDLDTWAIKPVDDWVPEDLRGQVKVVVGIKFDQLDGDPWPGFGDEPSYMTHVVQFCQWTLAAVPGHPLLDHVIKTSLERIDNLAAVKQTSISDLEPNGYEVITTTGPSAWTDVVFEHLQKADPSLQSLKELYDMKEWRLFGDVLVLTIGGFGMEPHSHSTADGSTPDAALMKHGFRHSWLPNVS